MADNRHLHRPTRLSLPPRDTHPSTTNPPPPSSRPPTSSYPPFPFASSAPTPTPSKHRLSSKTSSVSFLFLLLFSLRSLYSLLPFLRSSPSSFSLFPFSFLVSLLSFLLTLFFNLFPSTATKSPSHQKQRHLFFSVAPLKRSQYKFLVAKSVLLAIVFLLRFQALKYCGTAALILAELSGNVAARFLADKKNRTSGNKNKSGSFRGFIALLFGLSLLSISWDRLKCFPLSSINIIEFGFTVFPGGNCLRIWPMLLPFFSGFLGCYERVSMNWGSLRELGQKRVRVISLFFTTVLLFIPAVINIYVFEGDVDSVSVTSFGWPLANTVVFGVLLSENYSDNKFATSKDFQSEYLVTFLCTLVLELIYFSELSLWGLLTCGLFLWIAIRELDPVNSYYPELGVDSADSFAGSVMKPIRHILSERKSRKIALFLLINTAYMFVEFVAGFLSNSLGLISDACHMLFDCAALAIGLYASYISRLPANSQFNYGRGRFEVLSGYVNAVFLVLVGVLIVLESLERILEPQEISTNSLLVVSVGGLIVNVVGLIFFHEEHHHAHGGSCSHSHSHSHSHGQIDSHSHDRHQHNIRGHTGSYPHTHSNMCSDDQSNSHLHDQHQNHSHDSSNLCSCSHSDSHSHSHSHDHHQHHIHGCAESCSHEHSLSHSKGQSDSHSHNHHQHHAHGGSGSSSHAHAHSHSHSHSHSHMNHEHHVHGVADSGSHTHSHSHSHSHSDAHSHNHQPHHLHGKEYHAEAHVHSHSHGLSDPHSHDHHHHHVHGHEHHASDQGHEHHASEQSHVIFHGSHLKPSSDHENCHNINVQHQHSDLHHHRDDHHNSTESQDVSLKSLSGQSHEIHAGECVHVVEGFHNHVHTSGNEHDVQHHHHHHHHIDHNMEGIFLHVLADTLGSVGVVVATLLIKYRGWLIADPACSIFISVLIVSSVIPLLKNSAEILLQRVPKALEQNLKTALNDISKISGVHGIRNPHFWSLTNADVVGTLHLHLSAEVEKDFAKAHVSHLLNDAGIKDLTLQVECVNDI